MLLFTVSAAQGEMHFTDVTAVANILYTHSHAPGTTFENPEFGRMTGGAIAEDCADGPSFETSQATGTRWPLRNKKLIFKLARL